jgi:hypothetical protein
MSSDLGRYVTLASLRHPTLPCARSNFCPAGLVCGQRATRASEHHLLSALTASSDSEYMEAGIVCTLP